MDDRSWFVILERGRNSKKRRQDVDDDALLNFVLHVDWGNLPPTVREAILVKGHRWVREQNGGRLPLLAYLEHCITIPRPYVDVAPIFSYKNGSGHDILLIQRRMSETIFPGHWHVAGGATLVRQTVEEKQQVILVNECGATESTPVDIRFAGTISMPRLASEILNVTLFIACTREGWLPPAGARWFSLDNLPSPMVPHQRQVYIPLIIRILRGGLPEFIEYLGQE